MSADNGVYILETSGPEYRIVYAQAIDNIYGSFNDATHQWNGNPESILDCFGRCKVYTDLQEAWDNAEILAQDHDYLEDGVCLIPNFKSKSFKELING